MAKENTLTVCHRHLFDDIKILKDAKVSQQMINRIIRIRSIYTTWNDYPLKKDKEMRDRLIKEYDISQSEAYEDIKIIKQLLGDINSSTKAWQRYRVNVMLDEAYRIAQIKKNPIAMTMAADKIGKYNQLDKDDAIEYPWDEIKPQPFEPTSDPRVVGIKPTPNINEQIAKLNRKYGIEIEDVDYEEIGFDPLLIKEVEEYE